jgi:hypothetical protein
MSRSKVGHYVKSDIAMSNLTCLGEILTESCQKLTYSWRKMTELCPNDIITLKDALKRTAKEMQRLVTDQSYPK